MEKKELVRIFLDYNFNVATDALDYLLQKNISEELLRESIKTFPKNIPVIKLETVKKYLENLEAQIQISNEDKKTSKYEAGHPKEDHQENTIPHESKKSKQYLKTREKTVHKITTTYHPPSQIKIEVDIPEKTTDKPDITPFRRLFKDRFERLSSILVTHLNNAALVLKGNLLPEEIPRNKNGILIGMVQDTRVLHTNKFVIQLEDPESEIITNCVMVQDSKSFPEYRDIMRDSVIGISGVLPKNFRGGNITAFWGKDVIRPSFSKIHFKPTSEPHKLLFIADLHFGSKYFSRSIFAKLINFLNLRGEEINTIIIAGDLVDGVGRFSDQKQEILVHSLQAQYEGLATLLKEVPSHIQIIVIPGEHDATQTVLPQPGIDKQIGKTLLKLPNLKSYGNPLRFSIEDLNFLVFHGQGNDMLFQKHLQQEPTNLILGIQHLLEYRHLCPEYGSFNPLAPFRKDYLVIDKTPNIIISGHFHQAYFKEYKGVKIITCGTFMRGGIEKSHLEKDTSVGVVAILDTKSGTVDLIDLKTL